VNSGFFNSPLKETDRKRWFCYAGPFAPGAVSRLAESAPFPEHKTAIKALRFFNIEAKTFGR